ncbi:3-hydroxyacyl-CoA dehydrogenase [Candidatus Methylobacter favarea]|uniref:3-hydroxyacyl-CoA dehydrogenase n=1 Tax=Candidatus Methylobacter favarea TaxID=2707345 RepID=A0A8S0WQR4_9GAMM|nr:3-hydroxyacyl-CoA dehydrogenase/enoyl-CoA hydratase family protein [Candidatus Methylobacter favarea]CAA9891589.1 3-hydroxyacyl-CoA dehydrogenase [Candidatus Methylobacter favarea]
MNIQKAAVVGAGVMGASIAAHISNAGIPVYLLDIVPKAAGNRNIIAETAIQKLLKAEPAPFMHKNNARLVTPGNIEDHLHWLADVDWVIEAVIEDLQIKKSLYQKLEGICRKDCLISSNTSTLPLKLLVQDMPENFKQRFMITHFFNPPRYMRLLELISGPQSRPELVSAIRSFADIHLGKNCVDCKDTPGFIGNRIGIYWLQCGLLEAIDLGLTVEQADAVMSAPFGIPKTGIFGLLDLVGLDLIPHILDSMRSALPPQDAFHQINRLPELVRKMIADGYTGRKGKGGFYRLNEINGKRVKESINLQTGEYSRSERPGPEAVKAIKKAGLEAFLSSADTSAIYAWRVLSKTLAYTAGLVPEISDDIIAIDASLRDGYNWKYGPFELLDQLGVGWFVDKLQAENRDVPPLLAEKRPLYKVSSGKLAFIDLSGAYHPVQRAEGLLLLSDIKLQGPAVLENPSASLWDIGDGVACLEFHSKMNTLDMDSMTLIRQSIAKVSSEFSALVIHNEGENFSAGANLGLLIQAIHSSDWPAVEQLVIQGQQTYKALKYAPFPVVGAPSGLALGGGCEILLHSDAIQAHAELYMGLVEVGVGLIPAWGGCKEYLRRWLELTKRPRGPMPPVVKAFETISLAKVSKSAAEAKELLFLADSDGITMNKNRLLADAKAKALSLSENYAAPEQPCVYPMPGKTAGILLSMGIKAFRLLGKATAYDVEVSEKLAYVLSGGDSDITSPLTEDDMLALEREAFMSLVKQSGTLARLEHMLETGKPLRN